MMGRCMAGLLCYYVGYLHGYDRDSNSQETNE